MSWVLEYFLMMEMKWGINDNKLPFLQDGSGALTAAKSFHSNKEVKVIGYRYLNDSSITSDQRQLLNENIETRKTFNVLTDSEIVSLINDNLDSLPPPAQIVFRNQRCVNCGEVGDKRLLSPYCHLEKCWKHPGKLQRVHPGLEGQISSIFSISLYINHGVRLSVCV